MVDCYFLARAEGQRDNGFGAGLTDAQMRRQESFVGWDFWGTTADGPADIWIMRAGGYPTLAAFDMPTSGGSGTGDDPYLIESDDEFIAMCRDPWAHYRLTADVDLQGRYFLSAVIPLFWGHLDGAGHKAANFVLTGDRNLGVFGVLYPGAEVTDLGVQRARIVLTADTYDPAVPGSGVLAAHNRGKVIGCSAIVNIGIGPSTDFSDVGGLIGVNEGGEVSRCGVSCSMTFPSTYASGTPISTRYGGLVGCNNGLVSECHASSYVNGLVYDSGGLVGINSGDIVDCYAEGRMNCLLLGIRGPANPFTGGLVGDNAGTIANCCATTDVASPPISGSLVAHGSGSVTDSYFLSPVYGGGPDIGSGVALSQERMQTQASFMG